MRVILKNPATSPFADVADLGVAIQILRRGDAAWQHTGVLYKDENNPARVFHLRDHFDSRDEEPSTDWRWLQADFPEMSRRFVVELTKKIAARKDKLQFGFAFDGDAFSSDGEYLRQPTGMGLTCATVILKIFERLGLPILKCEEWQTREED